MGNITESDYKSEVNSQVEKLNAQMTEDTNLYDEAHDSLNNHSWFMTNRELNGADYGAIIYDFEHYGDVSQYTDPEIATSASDFNTVLRQMAFLQFKADVIGTYEEMLE